MKKILLFLVLAVTFNASAQISTTYFAKPLELNSVPASTSTSDSVIVRGADKILKFVPRSAFGGGGSQDLTSVLTNGYSVNNLPIFINRTDGAFQSGFRLINPTRYTELGDGYFRIVKNDLMEDTSYGNGVINYAFNADGSSIALKFPAVNIGTKFFPVSINSKYADATGNVVNTLDDNMVYGENLVTGSPDFGNKGIKLQAFSNPSEYTEIYPSGISLSGVSSIFNIAYTGYSLGNGVNTLSGDSNGFSYSYDGSFSRRYNFARPTDNLAKTLPISVNSEYADLNGNIVVTPATLQEVLTVDSFAEFDIGSDYSFVEFPNNGNTNTTIYAETSIGYSQLSVEPLNINLETKVNDNTAGLAFNDGFFRLSQKNLTNKTTVRALLPTVNTTINFPAPAVAGDYTLATISDFNKSYTVSTLPTPTGTGFAVVTDATAPTYLGTLTGGGSVTVPVFYNGTSWVAH